MFQALSAYYSETQPSIFRSADRHSRKMEQKSLEVFTRNSACTETWFELLSRHRDLKPM